MARVLEVQSTASSGEAQPLLSERRDVQFYYSALERARNCVVLPQGGFTAPAGQAIEGLIRNGVATVSLAGATITAPNGGTPANLTDGDPATVLTTSAVGAGTTVAVHVDLGVPTVFSALDVVGAFAELVARDQCLIAQWSTDNAAWTTIQTFDIDAGADGKRSRRFAALPGAPLTARYLRIATTGGAGLGTITIASIALWNDAAAPTAIRLLTFTFRKDQEYTLALSPGNGDVYRLGVWCAAFGVGLTSAMLAQLDWDRKLDSLLLFHEDLETAFIKRQGRHTEWNFAPYPYDNLPLEDFGAVYTNGVNAVQRVKLYAFGNAGEAFDLTLEGQTTSSIVTGANDAATAANIKAALEALPNVDAGLTMTALGGNTFDIEFSGGANANRPWLVMAGTSLENDGIVSVREMTRGKRPGEPVISAARGWPRTGRFFQQSLLVAGMKALPRHMMKSVTGSVEDFNTEITAATGAMLFEIEGGSADEIVKLHVGAALLAFTRDVAFYLDADSLSKTQEPKFKPTEQPGITRGIPLASLEGGLVYVEEGGSILRELKFSELQRNFSARNISVLSAHLLRTPVDAAHRRAVRSQENDMLFLVNADGSVIQMTALRSENITGFTLREQMGNVRAVTCDTHQVVRLAVLRGGRLWLERVEPECVTVGAHVAVGAGITSIAIRPAFNGDLVHVYCDRAYIGTRTVADGAISGLPASDRIEAGFAQLLDVIDMPVLKDEEAQRPMARLKRVYELHLSLFETDHLAVQVNGGEVFDIPLMQLGLTEIGESVGDRPFTGTVHLQGFPGFTETAQVRLLQRRPGRATVRQIRKSVRV